MTSKEVPFQGKILISGMFCKFEITYTPKTVKEVEDEMLVLSEMDKCIVHLMSINPLPTVVFPPFLDVGICLTGHLVTTSYHYESKGAGAHFAMLGFSDDLQWNFIETEWNQDIRWKDLQEYYINNNFVLFAPFLAYPRIVKLEKDQSQELIVLFRPPKPGQYTGVHMTLPKNLKKMIICMYIF